MNSIYIKYRFNNLQEYNEKQICSSLSISLNLDEVVENFSSLNNSILKQEKSFLFHFDEVSGCKKFNIVERLQELYNFWNDLGHLFENKKVFLLLSGMNEELILLNNIRKINIPLITENDFFKNKNKFT